MIAAEVGVHVCRCANVFTCVCECESVFGGEWRWLCCACVSTWLYGHECERISVHICECEHIIVCECVGARSQQERQCCSVKKGSGSAGGQPERAGPG